ncbi:DNA polymerase delta subunit 3 isoform X1 [Anabrus simplex]|uniref:DNA polymerase delta subunit 3 isoform X1 n=1 Tax=Anabrus simplex TaxID=316456 RepID=UPI0035A359F3
MNEELEKLYLQNIEEYIFDEDKIVTYKWLSKTLNVHVNTAKQLLYTFSTEIESNRKPELQLTYLVGGLLHDGKGCRFQVVREDDLLKVKNQFKVVTSEHIYSIHKSKRLSDLNILYGIDCIRESEDGGTMQGSIHCKKSVRRLEEQLAELRLQSRAASLCGNGKLIPQVTKNNSVKQCDKKPKSEETAQKKEKPSLFTTVSSKPSKPDKDVGNKSADPVESTSNNKKTKPSGTIASMFSAQSSKPKKTDSSVQKKTTTSEEAARTVASKSKEAGSISTMFANQTSKSKLKIETKQQAEEQGSGISSDADLKAAVEEKDITEKPTTAKRKHQTSEKAKSASKAKGKKPKKSSNDSNSQPAKKRKRIMIASDTDSSDDDIFGKEEDDGEEEEDRRDLEPEPDDSDVIPSTPQQEPNRGRKRKKKMVDRTFTDEEGYIITKKEYVYESCSGSEAEEEKKEDTKVPPKGASETVKTEVSVKPSKGAPSKKNSSPKKKQSPPQKAKQMTLTSFFKKN